MMPLSPPDAQVIKLIRTPKLPDSLFQNAQPLSIKVIASEGNQATILLAGRQLATQTTFPLTVGQTLSAQPSLVNGQLQLKILPTPLPTSSPQTATNTPQQPAPLSSSVTPSQNAHSTPLNLTSQTAQSKLPEWTAGLPNMTKDLLAALKQSLPNQTAFQSLLTQLNEQLQQATQTQKPLNPAWQTLFNQALNVQQQPLTAEKVQQAMQAFNDKFAKQTTSEWKQALLSLVQSPNASADEKQLAQQLLNRSELTQQLQALHHNTGNAVWLQEMPLAYQQSLNNFTLEIDLPKTNQPEAEQHWKIFVQLNLPQGDFTSRIQMDNNLNLRVQLWGSNEALTELLQTQAPKLRDALLEQGLNVESLIIVQGKPEPRTEKPLWQQPLVDCHG